MVAIRVDGNATIGTGHIMRCLTIAKAMKSQGESCLFITADNTCTEIIRQNGFSQKCLNSQWDDLSLEVDLLVKLITELSIDLLLIDSYFVVATYLKALKSLTYVAYIDDLNQFEYPCHCLINYNIYALSLPYYMKPHPPKLILGSAYTPLRTEFEGILPIEVRPTIQTILITTGGTDQYNICGEFITHINRNHLFSDKQFMIISGRFNNNVDSLKLLEKTYSNMKVYRNVDKMAELMLQCDLAISAGGSTLYELCACGVPTVCFSFADNQLMCCQTFADQLIMDYAGDYRKDSISCLEKIVDYIEGLDRSMEIRLQRNQKSHALVDGNGAMRLAQEVLRLHTKYKE